MGSGPTAPTHDELVPFVEASVLLVEDATPGLAHLHRALSAARPRWSIFRAGSLVEAARSLKTADFSVVLLGGWSSQPSVSLLEEAQRHVPAAVRFVVSGHLSGTSMNAIKRRAHRVLLMPSSVDDILRTLGAVMDVRTNDLLEPSTLGLLASARTRLGDLTFLQAGVDEPDPAQLRQLLRMDSRLRSDLLELSASDLVDGDPADNIDELLRRMGGSVVRDLSLLRYVMTALADAGSRGVLLDGFLERSLAGAAAAMRAALQSGLPSSWARDAFRAALFRDVGRLVLAAYSSSKEHYSRRIADPVHAAASANLLDRMGFDEVVVEAVRIHRPRWLPSRCVDVADAVAVGVAELTDSGVAHKRSPPSEWS